MVGQRKRKHAAVEDQHASKQTRAIKTQKSIAAFGTVGKAHDESIDAKKRKTAHQRDATPPLISPKVDRKRKRNHVVEDEEDEIVVIAPTTALREAAKTKNASTPRNKRFKNAIPPTPAETPTRSAVALFDRLKIDANARAIPCALQQQVSPLETPPDTPAHENEGLDLSFPPELEVLQDLHASFLASLSLYYSHNGTSSPVDARAVLSMMTKHWKKRSVSLDDLRRVLAIAQQQDQEFVLQDFGRAGTCLVRNSSRGRSLKRAASYIDEEESNRRFESALQKTWLEWQANAPKENREASAFVNQLELVQITQNESVEKAAPLFARGQQRLADLKAGQTAAKAESCNSHPKPPEVPKSSQATQSRGTALLDRILAKQNLASTLAAGPTKQQLERNSALHRIEDVCRILTSLAGAKARCSFSMPVIMQQLQQSLRNPIGKEEVERCLDLMAREITPSFVKVYQSGDVRGVVITRSGSLGLIELRARVEAACS